MADGNRTPNRSIPKARTQEHALKMQGLTMILKVCSTETDMTGGERISSNSGKVLRRGTGDSRRWGPPLLDSYLPEDLSDKALLLGHSPELEVISNDG
jgi:hypothetical protein